MTELRAAQNNSPELGDVLASIRRLIAQDDQTPDFAAPNRRTDASGAARSTLPLGPRTEKLRSVIERELTGVEFSDDRLILGRAARATEDRAARATESRGPDGGLAAQAAPLSDDHIGPKSEADESTPVIAQASGPRAGGGHSASVTPIAPHLTADRPTSTSIPENDMMLAEVNRATLQEEADLLHARADFDLFAADALDDDDQMVGGNALRDLVRDVIRQELQGEMGDRISRNLRRVVRQEVAAAITAGLKTA